MALRLPPDEVIGRKDGSRKAAQGAELTVPLRGRAAVRDVVFACWALSALSSYAAGQQTADVTARRDTTRRGGLPRNSWYAVPVLSRNEVTDLKVEGAVALLHRFALDSVTRPSLLFVTIAVTRNHQFAAVLGGEVWLPANRRGVKYLVQYQKFTAPFYGIGPWTTPATLELVDGHTWSGELIAQQTLRPADYIQLGVTIARQRVVARAPGGLLAPDTLPGSSGFTQVGLAVGLSHDSRTSTYYPRGGTLAQAQLTANPRALGSSSSFWIGTLDARRYLAVAPSVVLALQGFLRGAWGTVPFQLLPGLGGDGLRAYEDNRWQDRVLGRAQVEWRQTLFWRLGGVAFAAAGAVAPTITALRDSPLRTSYGVGLRLLVTRKVEAYFRGDYARSGDGNSALTFGFGEVL